MKHYQTGTLHHDPSKAYEGFTIIAPLRHEEAYIVNMVGDVVHTWKLPGALGSKGYLIPNGNFLCSVLTADGAPLKAAKGGHIVELDWDGNVVWEHVDHDQHHDLVRLDNGNTLYIAWEPLTREEIGKVPGGVPGTEKDGNIYSDVVREVTPAGDIVWEWHFNDVAFHSFPLAVDCERAEWAHANAVSPTNDGNVMVSFRHLDTIMIVDRETKDIIWQHRDRDWGHQHNCQMLPNGNITFFSNGMNNLKQPLTSRAMELDPKTKEIVWQYQDPRPWTFFTPVMGGVQRLENGNTLICEALSGRVFEVSPDDEMVWDYVAPMHFYNEIFDSDSNAMFRAYRHKADSPEIGGRL